MIKATFAEMESTPLDATYFMYVENSKAGIMKRSGMDVVMESPLQVLPMYNVSPIYTTTSFISASTNIQLWM